MARPELTLVLGLGESGLAMARWLARQGVALRVADSRDTPPGVERLRAEAPAAEIITGPFADSLLDGVSRLAISPGLDPRQPLVEAARARGIPVIGEMDLFAQALRDLGVRETTRLIAITGTNGKTTTTTLVGEMLRGVGLDGVVAGNISPATLDVVMARQDAGEPMPQAWALELSSFQLETGPALGAASATVLNVTDDHLDRYAGLDDYAATRPQSSPVRACRCSTAMMRGCWRWPCPGAGCSPSGLMRPPGRTISVCSMSMATNGWPAAASRWSNAPKCNLPAATTSPTPSPRWPCAKPPVCRGPG
jgi:hypothetical protein